MPKADTMVNKTPSMIKRNIVVYFLSLVNYFDEYHLSNLSTSTHSYINLFNLSIILKGLWKAQKIFCLIICPKIIPFRKQCKQKLCGRQINFFYLLWSHNNEIPHVSLCSYLCCRTWHFSHRSHSSHNAKKDK